ncbi:hypothetical protein AC1031_014653 [Aphanomyces cochlioides]|nr:hypothetical protein AC1031_014653 [Aphanomyces cochlioides]
MVLADDSFEVDGQPPPSLSAVPRQDMTSPALSQQAQRREAREVNRRPILDIRSSRLVDEASGEKVKEYEVRYTPTGAWVWVPELLIPATPLIYDFERELKGFNHLADLVIDHQLEVNPPVVEADEDDGTQMDPSLPEEEVKEEADGD